MNGLRAACVTWCSCPQPWWLGLDSPCYFLVSCYLPQGLGEKKREQQTSREGKANPDLPKLNPDHWPPRLVVPHTSSQLLQDSSTIPGRAGKVCLSRVSTKVELPQVHLEPIRRAHRAQSLQKVCFSSYPGSLAWQRFTLSTARDVESESTHPVCRCVRRARRRFLSSNQAPRQLAGV